MNGPTLDQVRAWARHVGMAGMITDVVTTMDELERFAALAYAAGQDAEREARIAAQQELAECREAMTRAEHEAQRARGELAAAVADEREACVQVLKDIAVYGKVFSRIGKIRTPAMNALHIAIDIIRARGQQ